MAAIMKCVQCVIWFFVISVCVAETVLTLQAGPFATELEFGHLLHVYKHPVCIVLLAAMHAPSLIRHAPYICLVVGALLLATDNWVANNNWFAASLIIISGVISLWMSRREASTDVEQDAQTDEEYGMAPSAAYPARQME